MLLVSKNNNYTNNKFYFCIVISIKITNNSIYWKWEMKNKLLL